MIDISIKKDLWDECIHIQDKVVENARSAMKEAQDSANDFGQPRDKYDSYRAQLMRKRDLFAEQYEKVKNEREILDLIDPEKDNDKVEFGAVVITNKQKLFIATGLGKIQLGEDIFYAISPKVPLFKCIDGLKKGDSFEFNRNTFTILDIL